MQQATVEVLIQEAYALVDANGSVNFAFQGGEPTLAGLEYFEKFVTLAKKLRPAHVQVTYAIQTNGMLLNEQWATFLREYDFLVGLSMDGYKDLHDCYRADVNNQGSWSTVRNAFQLLQNHKVRVNILCVVTKQCAQRPEKVYNELKKMGARYIQFIACMDPIGKPRGKMPFSLTPALYGKFLCRLFDLWYRDWETGNYHSIRLFDDYVNILLGNSCGTCATCGRCGNYFVVEGDGSVYPCDFFVLDRWRLGCLGEDTLKDMSCSEKTRKFLLWGSRKPAQCRSCRWRRLCDGGCKNDWQDENGVLENYYCEAFRALFAHAEQRLLTIARAEQTARRQIGV